MEKGREEVLRRAGDEERKGRGGKTRLCEARQAATTGCAYFMAATYHKSLSLMGERRSDDFKEITCRTRPTYTQPCWATQPLHTASKAARNWLKSLLLLLRLAAYLLLIGVPVSCTICCPWYNTVFTSVAMYAAVLHHVGVMVCWGNNSSYSRECGCGEKTPVTEVKL